VEAKFSDIGEILVKTPGAMLGYYKDEEKTREAFTADGFMRTGDVGELDAEGRLRITGRPRSSSRPAKASTSPRRRSRTGSAPIQGGSLLRHRGVLPAAVRTADADPGRVGALPRGAGARGTDAFAAAHLDSVNAQLDPHEQMDFVAVIPEQWTVDNGFITPTFKVKRPVIEKHYGEHSRVGPVASRR